MLVEDLCLGTGALITSVDSSDELLIMGDSSGRLLVFDFPSHRRPRTGDDVMNVEAESGTLLPGPCTALRLSPCGLMAATGDAFGSVRVYSISEIAASSPATSPMAEHRQHKGFEVQRLCWSADSVRVYSGCANGLIIELMVSMYGGPEIAARPALLNRVMSLTASLSAWMVPELHTIVICHHSNEATLQLSCCLTEAASYGPTDMVLVSTSGPKVVLFHFPRQRELGPRCSDLVATLPVPAGRVATEFSYASCFSSAQMASSVLVLRSGRCLLSAFYCNTNGIPLQEFILNYVSPLEVDTTTTDIKIVDVQRLSGTTGSLFIGTAAAGGGLLLLFLLDMAKMSAQILPVLPTDRVVQSNAHILAVNLDGSSSSVPLRKLSLLPSQVSLPVTLVGPGVIPALSRLQRIYRSRIGRIIVSTTSQTIVKDADAEESVGPWRDAVGEEVTAAECIVLEATLAPRVGLGVPSIGPPLYPHTVPRSQLFDPPLETFEISVVSGTKGLGLNLEVSAELRLAVQGFHRLRDGSRGPLELSGCVCAGDVLVCVNGASLTGLGIEGAVQALRSLEELRAEPDLVALRFEYGDRRVVQPTTAAFAETSAGSDLDPLFDVFAAPPAPAVATTQEVLVVPTMPSPQTEVSTASVAELLHERALYPSFFAASLASSHSDASHFEQLQRDILHKTCGACIGEPEQECVAAVLLPNRDSLSVEPPTLSTAYTIEMPPLKSTVDTEHLDASLESICSELMQAVAATKRRSGRGAQGRARVAAGSSVPPKVITQRVARIAELVLATCQPAKMRQLRDVLDSWSQCFSPITRDSCGEAIGIDSAVRDLTTLRLVLRTGWSHVAFTSERNCVGDDWTGRPVLERFGVYIAASPHRLADESDLWTDRVAAKQIALLSAGYMQADVAFAACCAVSYVETCREIVKVYSSGVEGSEAEAGIDRADSAHDIVRQALPVAVLLVMGIVELAAKDRKAFVEVCVRGYPALRPELLHRSILESRASSKTLLFAEYMAALVASRDDCAQDASCLHQFALASVDLRRVDESAGTGLLADLNTRMLAVDLDLRDTAKLFLSEGLLELAAVALNGSLRAVQTDAGLVQIRDLVRSCLAEQQRRHGGGTALEFELLVAYFESCPSAADEKRRQLLRLLPDLAAQDSRVAAAEACVTGLSPADAVRALAGTGAASASLGERLLRAVISTVLIS